ncbi:MAG: MFS transporter [Anaerolineaceae bacterium]|nr:MAG: MFS transporter [Anaerolineaceae bacterium]
MRDYSNIARKITRTLFVSQSIVTAGLIAIATVNAIAGADLSGVPAWAGIPSTVIILAAAVGAYGWGLLIERIGRRNSLAIGLVLGAVGAILAGGAIVGGSFLVFLAGLALVGFAQSAMQLGRFAAADVHPVETRGRAIASVVFGGTIGAILGPLLVGPIGKLAADFGLNELVGPYGIGLVFLSLAALIIFSWLRPDPTKIARELAQSEETSRSAEHDRTIYESLRQPAVVVAITAMVMGQMVMVMLMVITTLYMKGLGHTLTDISLVVSAHTFGMFAFSIVSGRLVDRIGREPVITMGSIFLILASVAAGYSSDVLPLAGSLFLLGLGWNFCYVGGSTLLSDQLSTEEQSRMQGFNDLLVGLASALGSLGSGFVFAAVGYRVMGFVGVFFALIPFTIALWFIQRRRQTRPIEV